MRRGTQPASLLGPCTCVGAGAGQQPLFQLRWPHACSLTLLPEPGDCRQTHKGKRWGWPCGERVGPKASPSALGLPSRRCRQGWVSDPALPTWRSGLVQPPLHWEESCFLSPAQHVCSARGLKPRLFQQPPLSCHLSCLENSPFLGAQREAFLALQQHKTVGPLPGARPWQAQRVGPRAPHMQCAPLSSQGVMAVPVPGAGGPL